MTDKSCKVCGALLAYYWLKDGMCNGCRNPESVVTSIPGMSLLDAINIALNLANGGVDNSNLTRHERLAIQIILNNLEKQ